MVGGDKVLVFSDNRNMSHPSIYSNVVEFSNVSHLAHGLYPLISWLREINHDYLPYLQAANISEQSLEDPEETISPAQELDFYSAAYSDLKVPELGLIIGPRYHLSSYGMLGLAAMTSADLYQCYQRYFDNIIMTWTYFRFGMYEEGDNGIVDMTALRDLGSAYSFMSDRDISACYKIACEALGQRLPLLRLELKQTSSDYTEKYQELFQAKVQFNSGRNALVFEKQWFSAKLDKPDPATSEVFAKQCLAISEKLSRGYNLTEHIRVMAMNLSEQPKTLDELAAQLHTTPRTLQRKLSAEGTTYKELIEEVRINIAIEFLSTSDLSIEAIASKAGYADTSSFSHAFKRWTEQTPSSFRSKSK